MNLWARICNGMDAGVMLVASFDLVQEGQEHGIGNWVRVGILARGIFIWLCKKFLEQYGEVSMLDIKGAEAAKVVLVIGITTLHSFGEGAGVGVGISFAGSKGFSQGILVTLARAMHSIPEGLAVSMNDLPMNCSGNMRHLIVEAVKASFYNQSKVSVVTVTSKRSTIVVSSLEDEDKDGSFNSKRGYSKYKLRRKNPSGVNRQ